MQHNLFRTAAIAAAATLAWSFAAAGDTLPMVVSATVVGTCKLVTVPNMSFGTLNQVTAPAVGPVAVSVAYQCTKGTTPSITLSAALSASPFTGSLLNTTGTDTIAYTVTWTNPATAGTGFGSAAQSLSLSGSIAASVYQNVAAGTYQQTVAVNITP